MAPLLVLLLSVQLLAGVQGALKLASYYTDHMVLQRGPHSAVVWGHATKMGDTVTVTVTDATGHDVTATGTVSHEAGGVWKVKLPPITSSGAHTVTAKSSEGTVSIKDVLFGDVWLCSGQSNMEFTMQNVMNSTQEIQRAMQFHNVRYMKASLFESNVALSDLHNTSAWSPPTAATLRPFSAVCWLFGEYLYQHLKQPIGLIESAYGGTQIEVWSSPDALSACASHSKRGPRGHSVLWNAMINPLLPLSVYGAIWYQGESNAANPTQYACQFPTMITDWRNKFHDASLGATPADFPFGFVQLAPYNSDPNRVGQFPRLRWAQTADVGYVPNPKMPRTFMAVAMDLPDFHTPTGPIHPRYKQDVAARLVLGARAVAYGEKNVEFQGPFPQSLTLQANHALVITYQNGPITVHNDTGFMVCCSKAADHCAPHDHWVPAKISSHTSTSVTLDTSGCQANHVTVAQYEWRESPCALHGCAVYGQTSSLPAPPFHLNVTPH